MSPQPDRSLSAGQLSHRITVEAPLGVVDETQAVDLDTGVPAKIEVLPPQFQARENLAAGGLQTQTIYTVTTRYREDIKAAFVLKEECCTRRLFQIIAIVPSDRRDALDMTCVTSS